MRFLWRFFSNIFLWLSLGALAVLITSRYFEPETLPKIEACGFKTMTGKPCPGCGMTRAFCAISHGRIGDAWHFNPFSFVFYLGAITLLVWPLLAWKFPKLGPWVDRTDLLIYVLPSVMIAMLIFGIVRMIVGPYV